MARRGLRRSNHSGLSDAEYERRLEQRLLDTPAAAAYLGLAPATLEIWRSVGRYDLPYFKVGHFVRYRQSDLDEWLARRVKTHTDAAAR